MDKITLEIFGKLILKKFIIDILIDYNQNLLNGKDFDFYSALSDELGKLNK